MKKTFEEIFKEHYKGNEKSLEESLIELKRAGCSQIQAIKLLINELGMPLSEADQIILHSKAWEQEKEATLKLRKNFEEGLSE